VSFAKALITLLKSIAQPTLTEGVYQIDYDDLVRESGSRETANKVIIWLKRENLLIDHRYEVRKVRVGIHEFKKTKEYYIVRLD